MTLQQMEYIVAVDEYRHFGKAADACNVTQPTLSLMIKKLEEEIDVQIFDRESHPVEVTELGRKIIDKAHVILFNTKQLVEMTKTEKQLASGKIKIAVISTVAPVMTPALFKFIGKNYPDIQIVVQEMLTDSALDKLRKAQTDMALVTGPVNDPDFLEIPLFHERFLAYVSEDNTLYDKEELTPDEILENEIWVMRDGLQKFDKSMLEPGDRFRYHTMYEGGRAGTLIYIVNELGGLTIVPELHRNLILFSMQKNLRPIVNPEVSRRISLVIRKDYVHEHLLNIVIDAVRSSVPVENQEDIIRRGWIIL